MMRGFETLAAMPGRLPPPESVISKAESTLFPWEAPLGLARRPARDPGAQFQVRNVSSIHPTAHRIPPCISLLPFEISNAVVLPCRSEQP